MAFLVDEDYKVMVGEKALVTIMQGEVANREKAEAMAQEEVSGYLRSRYDVNAVFAAKDMSRNTLIVMYTCDIALYHLISWLPGKMGYEMRKERYERAIKWLEGVQNGKTSPDLPTYTGTDGEEDINNPIRFGSETKNNYGW